MNNLMFFAVACGATGVALWLQRRHILYQRMTSALLVLMIGYILGSFKLININANTLTWVTELVLPLTLITALLSMKRSNSSGLTLRLMRGTGYTMVIAIAFAVVLAIVTINQLISKGTVTEITTYPSPLILMITPKDPYSAVHSRNGIFQAIALTTNTLAISIAVVIPVILQTAYKTVWLYMPLEEATAQRWESRINYYSKPSQNMAWGLGLSLSIAIFALTAVEALTSVFHPLPKLILLLGIVALLRLFAGIPSMASEFQILATLGSHLFLFSYAVVLGSCPWEILSASTVFLIVLLLIVKALVILIAGYRFGINIETLCTLFLAITCGPQTAATVCAAKKWEPLLPAAFLLGFVAQVLLWLACITLTF